MKNAYKLSLMVVLIFQASCTPDELPISVQPASSRIAVASLVGPENIVVVTLTRSFSALSATDINELGDTFADSLFVNRARVTITREGFASELNRVADLPGLYAAQIPDLKSGDVMELFVYDSVRQEQVQAVSVLQQQAAIDSIRIIQTLSSTSDETGNTLSLRIENDPNDQFFVVHAYQFEQAGDSTETDSASLDLFGRNQFLTLEDLFTDLGSAEDYISVDFPLFLTEETDSALVVVTQIEEGYYRYLDARRRSGDLVSSIFNEPVNHPTNVVNGYGYFSAHQPVGRIIRVERRMKR